MKHIKLIFFVLLTFTVNAQQLYFPGQDWEEREPQSLGFSNEKIKEAHETKEETEERLTKEFENLAHKILDLKSEKF